MELLAWILGAFAIASAIFVGLGFGWVFLAESIKNLRNRSTPRSDRTIAVIYLAMVPITTVFVYNAYGPSDWNILGYVMFLPIVGFLATMGAAIVLGVLMVVKLVLDYFLGD